MTGVPALPEHAALLLDLDGTLLDIAPSPSAVVVDPALPDTLRRLRRRLEDALAVVTGRPVEQVERLLQNIPYAIAGEHGAVIRHDPTGALEHPALPDLPGDWLDQAQKVAGGYAGVLLERKSHGFVLHYRQQPEAGPALRQALLSIVDGHPSFTIMPAHMAWELKPGGVDKGTAVRSLMSRPPFAGRVPVYIGDDVTDEDGMRAARAMGGVGLRVQDAFGDPAGVRAWLGGLAAATLQEGAAG